MDTPTANPAATTIDLAGLPESVVADVRQLVAAGRLARNGVSDLMVVPRFVSRPPPLTPEESRKLLEEMASMSSGQSLPIDFSTADIYDDHD